MGRGNGKIDATEDVREVLASLGWKSLDAPSKDTRGIHQLAPTEKPVKRLTKEQVTTHPKQGEKGWTIAGVRNNQMGEVDIHDQVEGHFMTRLEAILHAPEADEARRILGQEDGDLLQKMEDTQESLNSKRGVVKKKFDKLGVFSKSVNQVRANALYRVELRRRLQNNEIRRSRAITKKTQRAPGDQLSLEAKLQNLLDDLSVLDGDPENNTSRKMDNTMSSAVAAAAIAAQRSSFLPPEVVEARRAEAQAAVTDMISRYRKNVEDRRNQILLDMGIDPTAALENGSGAIAAAAYDNMLQSMEKEEVDRSIKVQSTTALVEAALARVETVTERMAAAEQAAADEASAAEAAERERDARLDAYSREQEAASTSASTPAPAVDSRPPTTTPAVEETRQPQREESKAAPAPATTPAKNVKVLGASTSGQVVTGEQVAEEKMKDMEIKPPALPELILDEGLSLAEQLQKRLERVWHLLRMPVMEKLDMVIKYTSKELSHSLELALHAWEDACAAVLGRERALNNLEELGSRNPSQSDPEMQAALDALERATVFVVQVDRRLKTDFGDTLTFEGVPYCERKDEADWWTGGTGIIRPLSMGEGVVA